MDLAESYAIIFFIISQSEECILRAILELGTHTHANLVRAYRAYYGPHMPRYELEECNAAGQTSSFWRARITGAEEQRVIRQYDTYHSCSNGRRMEERCTASGQSLACSCQT
jgi:hypothetical protein